MRCASKAITPTCDRYCVEPDIGSRRRPGNAMSTHRGCLVLFATDYLIENAFVADASPWSPELPELRTATEI